MTAGWSSRGPRTRSRLGWNWVSRPRIRLLVRVASAARSWSKPVSTVSSAVISSVSSSERRMWGIVRAASAITAASFPSVFASPG